MKKILFLFIIVSSFISPLRGAGGVSVIDLGQVQYMKPATGVFQLKNTSRKPLRIEKVDTGCGCTLASYPEEAVPGGKDYAVTVTYDSRLMGHFDKIIEVYTSGSKKPLRLELRGVVVEQVEDFVGDFPFEIGSLKADCNYIEFDDVHKGEVVQQKFHIYNSSGSMAEPQIMHLPDYLTAEISPSVVAPSHSAEVTLTFNSASLRDYGLTQSRVYLSANPGEKVSKDKEIGLAMVLLSAAPTSTSKTYPRLWISSNTLSLPVADGKKKSGTIELRNNGTATLDIQNLQMFTDGMEVELNKRNINPGETARLKVTVIPQKMQNLRTSPRIMMITNDPDQGKVVIGVNTK